MPEKPEVITVARKLETKLLNRKIINVEVLYKRIIETPSVEEFVKKIVGQTIHSITTRGKWIVFELDADYMLAHLRMEGKFFFRKKGDTINKHEHVIFRMDNDEEFRFSDPRKFARLLLIKKENLYSSKPYNELGYEPWDKLLTSTYLKEKLSSKRLPMKSILLDQSIIAGIGNIYADEILFLSNINPNTRPSMLNDKDFNNIIINTIKVLDKAVLEGGTTIRSYTSEEGVTGRFQNSLNVHAKKDEACPICKTPIIKIRVGGRGTYYCPKCQKEK